MPLLKRNSLILANGLSSMLLIIYKWPKIIKQMNFVLAWSHWGQIRERRFDFTLLISYMEVRCDWLQCDHWWNTCKFGIYLVSGAVTLTPLSCFPNVCLLRLPIWPGVQGSEGRLSGSAVGGSVVWGKEPRHWLFAGNQPGQPVRGLDRFEWKANRWHALRGEQTCINVNNHRLKITER